MLSIVRLSLSAGVVSAAIPGWGNFKLKDFCNGSCPSTPGSSGLPRYGQELFPSMTFDTDANIYLVSATFGGAYMDNPKVISLTSSAEVRWSREITISPQSSYQTQVVDGSLYVLSSGCCTASGAEIGHVVKVALNGTLLWSLRVDGSPSLGYDGKLYTLATTNTLQGTNLSSWERETGKLLWSYSDGTSRFAYLEIGGPQAKYGYLCMPAEANNNKSVVCLDSAGKLVHQQQITDSPLVRYDLIASEGNYYVRLFRDNSYYHKGANKVFELGQSNWTQSFPDDIDFVGVISRTSEEAFVVLTRPECAGIASGWGCRPDSLIAFSKHGNRWNVTLPGKGDITVNPAFPPQFGPYGAANGMVFVSSVETLHADNKTYDMWYTAVDASGAVVWKESIANFTDLTSVTYAATSTGDFHIVFDGILYKVLAKSHAAENTMII